MKDQPEIASPKKEKRLEDKTASAEFRFGVDNDLQPKISGLAADTEVTITLKGKITSYNHDQNSEWNKDLRFSLSLTDCTVKKEDEISSMADAIDNANENRKVV